MKDRRRMSWLWLAAAAAAFIIVIANGQWWEWTLGSLFPEPGPALHPRASLLVLVGEHLQLVVISSLLTIAFALPLGVFVTRGAGHPFLPIVTSFTALGQTFPPVAVLALTVPLMGFGLWPTVTALFLYGLLPIVRNTVAGLEGVPPSVLEAARGMGMGPWQTLARVEFPLAAPVIMGGVRTSVTINIGTAMIGAVIGAGGLGSPIVAGLVQDNLAFIIEGALPAALLALLVDAALGKVEGVMARSA
jgi:osmoprotectant transport system permease protein